MSSNLVRFNTKTKNVKWRKEKLAGETYSVFPVVMCISGVRNQQLVLPEELARDFYLWQGRPVTAPTHPMMEINNRNVDVSANIPEIYNKNNIGTIFNTSIFQTEDERIGLQGEAWISHPKAKELGFQYILDDLKSSDTGIMNVSIGMTADAIDFESTDEHGRYFRQVLFNYRPDHLALLTSENGACKIEDGCGVRNSPSTMSEKVNFCEGECQCGGVCQTNLTTGDDGEDEEFDYQVPSENKEQNGNENPSENTNEKELINNLMKTETLSDKFIKFILQDNALSGENAQLKALITDAESKINEETTTMSDSTTEKTETVTPTISAEDMKALTSFKENKELFEEFIESKDDFVAFKKEEAKKLEDLKASVLELNSNLTATMVEKMDVDTLVALAKDEKDDGKEDKDEKENMKKDEKSNMSEKDSKDATGEEVVKNFSAGAGAPKIETESDVKVSFASDPFAKKSTKEKNGGNE